MDANFPETIRYAIAEMQTYKCSDWNANNLYICTNDISTYCLESDYRDYNLMELGCKIFTSTGCCFVKFATSEEADRAIRALHNQVTLPGVRSVLLVRSYLFNLMPPYLSFLVCGFSRDWVPFKLGMLMENANALVIFQVLFDLSTQFCLFIYPFMLSSGYIEMEPPAICLLSPF